MRWLLDTLHYARDRESVSGIPLDLVFDTQHPSSPEPYDSHRKYSKKTDVENGKKSKCTQRIYQPFCEYLLKNFLNESE